jgi:hypothetical protein
MRKPCFLYIEAKERLGLLMVKTRKFLGCLYKWLWLMGLGKKKNLIFLDFFVEGDGKGSEKGKSDGRWERAGFAGAAQGRQGWEIRMMREAGFEIRNFRVQPRGVGM